MHFDYENDGVELMIMHSLWYPELWERAGVPRMTLAACGRDFALLRLFS